MTMVRRMNMSKRPIHSIKHVIDFQGGVAADTNLITPLVDGSDAPTLAIEESCEVGARVNAVFLNVTVQTLVASGALNNIYMFVYGNPGNNIGSASIPKGNAVGVSDFKNMIFHQEMTMIDSTANGAIPKTLFKGVISIPRKFRRIGVDDRIAVIVYSTLANSVCIQCIYKEYR